MRKLAISAFSFSAAIFLSHLLLPREALLPFAAAVGAVSLISIKLRGDKRTRLLLVTLFFLCGLIWSASFDALRSAPAERLAGNTEAVTAVAQDFPVMTDYGERIRVRIKRPGADITAVLYMTNADSGLSPGDIIEFTARFESSAVIRGEETNVFRSRGEFLLAYISGDFTVTGRESAVRYFPQRLARSVSDMAGTLFGDKLGPFMRALLVGDTAELNRDTVLSGALSVTGAAHIVSVSGMHLAFLMGFLSLVIRRRRLLAAVATPLIVMFMAMTGFDSPIVRAGVMQLFLLAAPLFGRESDGITSLSAALFILLAVNPYASMSIGLQLSFAATLGMVLFTGRIYNAADDYLCEKGKYKRRFVRPAARFVISSAASTIGASVFTIPLVAVYFGMVSLIAPVTNLVTLWAVSLAFCLGLAACTAAFVVMPLGSLIARAASVPGEYVTFIIRVLGRIPYAAVYVQNTLVLLWLVYVYVLGITLAALRAKARRLLYPVCSCLISLCLILLITPRVASAGDLSVTALDVGQGQCIIVMSDRFTAMIDCGGGRGINAGAVAVEFLASHGITALDLLILTHFHSDHADGAEYLLGMINVASFAIPDPDISESYLSEDITELARRRGTDIMYITQTMTVTHGDTQITLFPPLGDEDENERGLAALVEGDGLTALVTGDMDARSERRLLRFTDLPDIDVLVVGHHGSRYSTSEELLIAVMPEIALISSGVNNYGHPSDEVLARLAEYGVAVYRTDISGSVTVGAVKSAKEKKPEG